MNICLTGNTFHPIAKGELITGYNIAASDLVNSFLIILLRTRYIASMNHGRYNRQH